MRLRNNTFRMWLSDEEYKKLQTKSKKAGLTRGQFIRNFINEVEVKARPPDNYYKLLKEINAIGVNINQIAHIANFERTVGDEKIAYAVELVEEIMEKVRDLE